MRPSWVIILAFVLVFGLAGCTREQKPSAGDATQPRAEQSPRKDELIDVDIPPQLVKRVVPEYPDSVRAEGIEGIVYVKALVGTDGNVKTVEVIKGEGRVPALEQSALEAAKGMSFAPAKKDGKAVAVWVTIPFRFALRKPGGAEVLSELKRPNDAGYVEGYLEGLQATERQVQRNLEALRARNADTKEVERTLERLKAKISTLQAHLAKLKASNSTQ